MWSFCRHLVYFINGLQKILHILESQVYSEIYLLVCHMIFVISLHWAFLNIKWKIQFSIIITKSSLAVGTQAFPCNTDISNSSLTPYTIIARHWEYAWSSLLLSMLMVFLHTNCFFLTPQSLLPVFHGMKISQVFSDQNK